MNHRICMCRSIDNGCISSSQFESAKCHTHNNKNGRVMGYHYHATCCTPVDNFDEDDDDAEYDDAAMSLFAFSKILFDESSSSSLELDQNSQQHATTTPTTSPLLAPRRRKSLHSYARQLTTIDEMPKLEEKSPIVDSPVSNHPSESSPTILPSRKHYQPSVHQALVHRSHSQDQPPIRHQQQPQQYRRHRSDERAARRHRQQSKRRSEERPARRHGGSRAQQRVRHQQQPRQHLRHRSEERALRRHRQQPQRLSEERPARRHGDSPAQQWSQQPRRQREELPVRSQPQRQWQEVNLFDSPRSSSAKIAQLSSIPLLSLANVPSVQDGVPSPLVPLFSIDDNNVPLLLRSGNHDSVVDNDAASLLVNCNSRSRHRINNKSYNNNNSKKYGPKDSDLNHLKNYDSRGRCVKHPHVKLRRRRKNLFLKKNRLENDKWEVFINVCPDCCVEELSKIASATSTNTKDADDPLDNDNEDADLDGDSKFKDHGVAGDGVKYCGIIQTDTVEATEDSSISSDGSAARLPVAAKGPFGKRMILKDDNHQNNPKLTTRLSQEYVNVNQDIKRIIRKLRLKCRVGWRQ